MDIIKRIFDFQFFIFKQEQRGGFTLIELLVVIGIISVLVGLLVPGVDRSLSQNRLVADSEVFAAKVEQARLLAGSTQQVDARESGEAGTFAVGYYGVFIPADGANNFFIIRLSYPFNYEDLDCDIVEALNQLGVGGRCIVEEVKLNRNVRWQGRGDKIVAFRVPTQQVFEIQLVGSVWRLIDPPIFDFESRLTLGHRAAKIKLEPYTAKIKINYE